MNSRNSNRKYIFFLLALSAFGAILYRNIGVERSSSEVVKQKAKEEVVTESVNDSEGCFDCSDISPILVDDYVDIGIEEPIDVNGSEVLGDSIFKGSCDYYEKQYNIGALCDDAEQNTPYDDNEGSKTLIGNKTGGDVKSERKATIQLVKVTYPAQFWNGSKVVKDNAKSISISDPVYLSSGDYLSLDYGQKLLAPTEVDRLANGTQRLPFGVVASNYIDKAKEILNDQAAYVINREDNIPHYSLCDRSIQPSAFNPTLTNKVGEIVYNYLEVPGGDPKEEVIQSNCVATEDSLEYALDEKDTELVCSEGLVAKFIGRITSYFSDQQWHSCETGSTTVDENGNEVHQEDICATPEKIVVEMSSLFGYIDQCHDGVCGNAALTNRFLATETPGEASEYKTGSSNSEETLTMSILTPCQVELNVEGIFTRPETVDVYCKWDATPNIANYRSEAVENIPNDPDFPQSYDQYWSLVEKAIARDSKLSAD